MRKYYGYSHKFYQSREREREKSYMDFTTIQISEETLLR